MRRKTKMQIMAFPPQSQFPALGSFHIGYFFFINQLLDEAEYDLKNYADRRGC